MRKFPCIGSSESLSIPMTATYRVAHVGPVFGVGSVYSPSTWPSTRRARRGRGCSAVRRRCRGCATPAAAQPAPRELRRRVADREPDRAARDGERLGLVDLQRPARDEVIRARSAASRIAPRAQPAVGARRARPTARDAPSTEVDRSRDAPPLDVGEHVRPDVRGDVEIFGQLVARHVVAVPALDVAGHGADATAGQAAFSLS